MSTQQQKRDGCGVKNALHGFFSFTATGFVSELPASSCIGMLVCAPCATISFLSASALPISIFTMATGKADALKKEMVAQGARTSIPIQDDAGSADSKPVAAKEKKP